MCRLLVAALSALLLALLAACESTGVGVLPDRALDAPRRCTHCGWIVSKQQIGLDVANLHAPVIYEYTVRMANGSLKVFREGPAVHWRVGERLMLLARAGD